jgi:excisionase family DNA binding protein
MFPRPLNEVGNVTEESRFGATQLETEVQKMDGGEPTAQMIPVTEAQWIVAQRTKFMEIVIQRTKFMEIVAQQTKFMELVTEAQWDVAKRAKFMELIRQGIDRICYLAEQGLWVDGSFNLVGWFVQVIVPVLAKRFVQPAAVLSPSKMATEELQRAETLERVTAIQEGVARLLKHQNLSVVNKTYTTEEVAGKAAPRMVAVAHKPQQHGDFLKAKDVRASLGCSLSKVYELFHEGQISGYRVGTSIFFHAASVENYKQQNANPPKEQPAVRQTLPEAPRSRKRKASPAKPYRHLR